MSGAGDLRAEAPHYVRARELGAGCAVCIIRVEDLATSRHRERCHIYRCVHAEHWLSRKRLHVVTGSPACCVTCALALHRMGDDIQQRRDGCGAHRVREPDAGGIQRSRRLTGRWRQCYRCRCLRHRCWCRRGRRVGFHEYWLDIRGAREMVST